MSLRSAPLAWPPMEQPPLQCVQELLRLARTLWLAGVRQALMEEQTQRRIELLQRENERLKQEAKRCSQQAVPLQHGSPAPCQAPEDHSRRILELERKVERLIQDRERLLGEARLQQEQRVTEQAAGEKQRSRMEALEERVAQLAGRLCEAVTARGKECAAHRQASPEQQGRTLKRLRRSAEHPGGTAEQLQEPRPAQCQAAAKDVGRGIDVLQRDCKRLRQGEGSRAEAERCMPQPEQPGATLAPTAEGRTARVRDLLQPPQLGARSAPSQPVTPPRPPSPPRPVLPF